MHFHYITFKLLMTSKSGYILSTYNFAPPTSLGGILKYLA